MHGLEARSFSELRSRAVDSTAVQAETKTAAALADWQTRFAKAEKALNDALINDVTWGIPEGHTSESWQNPQHVKNQLSRIQILYADVQKLEAEFRKIKGSGKFQNKSIEATVKTIDEKLKLWKENYIFALRYLAGHQADALISEMDSAANPGSSRRS